MTGKASLKDMTEAHYIEHPQPLGAQPPHPVPERERDSGAISEPREMAANKETSRFVSLPHFGQKVSTLLLLKDTKMSNLHSHDRHEYSYIGTSLSLHFRYFSKF